VLSLAIPAQGICEHRGRAYTFQNAKVFEEIPSLAPQINKLSAARSSQTASRENDRVDLTNFLNGRLSSEMFNGARKRQD
jgi:hypothetical protein